MKLLVKAFWLPKAGNAMKEYEDAFWPSRADVCELKDYRLAVADGATEASFSKLWADLLVRAYCKRILDPQDPAQGLTRLERIWRRIVDKKVLPWYAEQKRDSGAFAAIAGIEIRSQNQRWSAFACGDTCIFHTREDKILASFPLDDYLKFNDRPLLLSSIAANNSMLLGGMTKRDGVWQSGDRIFLMSDALAAWFLRRANLPEGDPVCYLTTLATQEDFAEFVVLQRNDRSTDGSPMMRNDDVTLVECLIV